MERYQYVAACIRTSHQIFNSQRCLPGYLQRAAYDQTTGNQVSYEWQISFTQWRFAWSLSDLLGPLWKWYVAAPALEVLTIVLIVYSWPGYPEGSSQ